MYLAFKWLILLAVAMWALLCAFDAYTKTNKEIISTDFIAKAPTHFFKNSTLQSKNNLKEKLNLLQSQEKDCFAIIHYFMFIAGALAVTIYNRKSEIYLYTKNKLHELNFRAKVREICKSSKKTAKYICVAILKTLIVFWGKIENIKLSFKIPLFHTPGQSQNQNQLTALLLKKLKDIGQERNSLGQLLIAAIQENKNIRLQYQLENLTKTRLMRQIQDIQKQMKDNKSRYASFQQLYLVTHQENIFLKNRIKKLNKAKDEAEKQLMMLINEVYQSKDCKLKAYCTNFIVLTKEDILNSDVNADVKTYLQKTREAYASSSNCAMSSKKTLDLNSRNSWPNTCLNVEGDDEVSLVEDARKPTLRGLPGEYVWTVKDKDGIIEKLYEYDYGYSFDNGDTIRRIREYSVYHDKDCLLDFENSRSTTIFHENRRKPEHLQNPTNIVDFPASRNFLTGSPAFQKFLENNPMVVTREIAPAPPLLCG